MREPVHFYHEKHQKHERLISKYLREAQTFADHVFILFILSIHVNSYGRVNQDEFTKRMWTAGQGRHFREQLVSKRFGQPLDDGAKNVTDAHTDARQ
jgi:hypothetical protein